MDTILIDWVHIIIIFILNNCLCTVELLVSMNKFQHFSASQNILTKTILHEFQTEKKWFKLMWILKPSWLQNNTHIKRNSKNIIVYHKH